MSAAEHAAAPVAAGGLDESGFEITAPILGAFECAAFAELAAAAIRGRAGSRRLLEAGWCQSLATRLRREAPIAARLPGVAVQCTLFSKTPGANWLVAHHQDFAIPVRARVESPECSAWSEKEGVLFVQPPRRVLERLLAVRLHLDDCTADNGALRVVPGSHRSGRLSASQEQELRASRGEVTCIATRGSALLMRPLLLHASSKATNLAPRRVLHFLFGPQTLPLGLEWHTMV